MEKKEYMIPIHPRAELLKIYNAKNQTEYKPTVELICDMSDQVAADVVDFIKANGSYVGDQVKITVQMEYIPEDK